MATRLEEVLEGKEDNYLLPFIWQHGEEETVIREEMARIQASGIGAVCVEARPHPDFLGPRWWHDMDIIMEEARQRGMRVWLLDDDHFPTGHAAGRLVNAPPELRRLFLKEQHVDAVGPQAGASFLVKPWLAPGDRLLAAVAARREASSTLLNGELLDVTTGVAGDVLYWDVPAGFWRIFLLIETPTGGYKDEIDYINPLVAASVRVLLDTVYEPFYARYPADFGKTYAGFFSDEPGFYNDKDGYDYLSSLGKKEIVLPWSHEMLPLLTTAFGQDFTLYLPLLWHAGGERTGAARYTYMDVVSKLYAENFTNQIGDWCRAHRVEYIGHVLEDNGVHARLGIGAAHFFRALWGQDMAGLDVVLWQLVPGFDEGPFTIQGADADGEFYHYGLGKLGSSLAHIDPKKQGRTMCEVFGAYGWREGLRLMKWMTDHMLVRGVNYFVPHAFSQAPFPDPDCPPHFYARGKNPQYRYYHLLNRYTNRLSHLLSGGVHVASTAVLYHAEAEWSGAAMPFEKPLKELMRRQVDGDVIPGDVLLDSASVSGGKLCIAAEQYDCLVIPFSEALPAAWLARLAALAGKGLPLFFVDGLPQRASDGKDAHSWLAQLPGLEKVRCLPLADLARAVRQAGFCEVGAASFQPYLRHYHVRYPDLEVYFFFNEHPYETMETHIDIPGEGRLLGYQAFQNRVIELECTAQDGRLAFPLQLSPYESIVVLVGPGARDLPAAALARPGRQQVEIRGPWSVSTATAGQYPVFTPWRTLPGLSDLAQPGALPSFSGTFRSRPISSGAARPARPGLTWARYSKPPKCGSMGSRPEYAFARPTGSRLARPCVPARTGWWSKSPTPWGKSSRIIFRGLRRRNHPVCWGRCGWELAPSEYPPGGLDANSPNDGCSRGAFRVRWMHGFMTTGDSAGVGAGIRAGFNRA